VAAKSLLQLLLVVTLSFGCSRPSGPAPLKKAEPLPNCEQAAESRAKERCYEDEAKARRSPGLCLHLGGAERQFRCVADLARDSTDPSLCEQAAALSPSPRCYEAVAVNRKAPELCAKVRTLDQRISCVAAVAQATENVATCAAFPTAPARANCIEDRARQKEDASLCDAIERPSRRDACRIKLAFWHKKPESCGGVQDQITRDGCFLDLVESDGAPELCEKAGARRDYCYVRAAAKSDLHACERVGTADSLARQFCYARAVEQSREPCSVIPTLLEREECVAVRASRSPESAGCETITTAEIADRCWMASANRSGNACLNVKHAGQRRLCILNNWPKATDPRVCAQLPVFELRDACAARTRLNKP
jgi:hypothetical protein